MLLQAKLDAFKANFESGGPPFHAPAAVHEPMRRATAELIASGVALQALTVGDKAPAFELNDANSSYVSLASLLERGPLVLTFYRGFWCPYCNLELEALQEALADIRDRGASLVAISPQTASNSRRAIQEKHLGFPILFDPGNQVAASFGLRYKLPDYLIELYRDGFKNDLAVTNGDPSWTLPMPARYIIAKSGNIAYSEVNPDYTKRPDPSELLPILDLMSQSAGA
jgi:peroxiredoxin